MRIKILLSLTAATLLCTAHNYAAFTGALGVGAAEQKAAASFGASVYDPVGKAFYMGAGPTKFDVALAGSSIIKVSPGVVAGAAPVVTPFSPNIDLNGLGAAASPFTNGTSFKLALFPVDGAASMLAVAANDPAGVANIDKVYLITDMNNGTVGLKTANGTIFDGSLAAQPVAINKSPVALAASTPLKGAVAGVSPGNITADKVDKQYIFAAVNKENKTQWGDPTNTTRGIAVILKEAAALEPKQRSDIGNNASGAGNDDGAAQVIAVRARVALDFAHPGEIAFSKGVAAGGLVTAELSDGVSMTYSKELQRLYVGLEGVKRDSPIEEGGVTNILVGDIDQRVATTFTLGPIVEGLEPKFLYDKTSPATTNINDRIIGFYYDGSTPKVNYSGVTMAANNGNDDVAISAKQLNVMHTSTNKDYLVLNGVLRQPGIAVSGGVVSRSRDWFYALPLTGNKTYDQVKGLWNANWGDGTPVDEAPFVGVLSAVSNDANGIATFKGAPTSLSDMPYEKQKAVMIGGASHAIDAASVSSMFVSGDAVYMCSNGTRASGAGIFQSTAIFDTSGSIAGWTPVTRVAGNMERVLGGGVDATTGNFYFASTNNNVFTPINPSAYSNYNAPRITQWGTALGTKAPTDIATQRNTGTVAAAVQTVESNISTILAGDTYQIFEFDEYTPGFATGKFSMMAALVNDNGNNYSLKLLQTGKYSNSMFVPVKHFDVTVDALTGAATAATGNNTFSLPIPAALGTTYLAEVSRSTTAGHGWVFVGGQNGVAVLATAAGTGFTKLSQLSTANDTNFPKMEAAPAANGNYFFKQLQPADNTPITGVRKLVSNGNALFIMTQDRILRVPLDDATRFAGAGTTCVNLVDTVTWSTGTIMSYINPVTEKVTQTSVFGSFTDMLALSDGTLIIAATNGLFAAKPVTGASFDYEVHLVNNKTTVYLDYLSMTRGVLSQQGQLYAVMADYSGNTGSVYRYYVDSTLATPNVIKPLLTDLDAVTKQPTPYVLDGFRLNVTTDGSVAFASVPKDTTKPAVLEWSEQTPVGAGVPANTIPAVVIPAGTFTGVIAREPSSGSWILPTNNGVIVNE